MAHLGAWRQEPLCVNLVSVPHAALPALGADAPVADDRASHVTAHLLLCRKLSHSSAPETYVEGESRGEKRWAR